MVNPVRARRLSGAAGVAGLLWLASPLQAPTIDCSGRAGIELARCERHQKACEPQQGREFMRCASARMKASPMGQP